MKRTCFEESDGLGEEEEEGRVADPIRMADTDTSPNRTLSPIRIILGTKKMGPISLMSTESSTDSVEISRAMATKEIRSASNQA